MMSVLIKLDKERQLRLTLGAMAAFEAVTGKNLLQGLDISQFSATDMRALIWACLIHEDPTLKLEDVGNMVDVADLPAIAEKLGELWNKSVPASDPLSMSP